jgi:hypothetical protein
MKKVQKVINCIFRYEMGFSLKNSGFSYLYGSISYLFGYENFGCFFLMCRGKEEFIYPQNGLDCFISGVAAECRRNMHACTPAWSEP